MKHPHTTSLFLLLAIAAFSAEGCTFLLSSIGASIDNINDYANWRSDTTAAFTKPIFSDVNSNTKRFARIRYNDSTVHYATFEGYTDEPDSEYRERWTSFETKPRSSRVIPLQIGDSIETLLKGYEYFTGQFRGFTPDGIAMSASQKGVVQDLPVSGMSYFHVNGNVNSLTELKSTLDSNNVPVKAILHFSDQQKLFTLTNTDFYNTTFIEKSNTGQTIGLVIGVLIDIGIVVFIAELSAHPIY